MAKKELWQRLDRLPRRPETRSGLIPARPTPVAEVWFFGRDRTAWTHDGVLLAFS